MKKTVTPLIGEILQKMAQQIGAVVTMEPGWRVAGQIVYKSGRRRYFRYSSLDINPLGASEIAKDKDYANFFMQRMGYPIVPGSRSFYSDEWSKIIGARNRNITSAYLYARKLGFPIVVKPNSGSHGTGVSIVNTKLEFYKAIREVFKKDRVVLVQKPLVGRDYRIVVLDNRVMMAYERLPLSVVGNGMSSIRQLLAKKQILLTSSGRRVVIKMNDPRIKTKLKREGLGLKSVPKKGKRVLVLDNANLSTGGDALDVTTALHPEFKEIAVQLAKDIGLRLCGIDLIVKGGIDQKPTKYWILEVNHSPGLDHYARIGQKQLIAVEDLCLRMLRIMEK